MQRRPQITVFRSGPLWSAILISNPYVSVNQVGYKYTAVRISHANLEFLWEFTICLGVDYGGFYTFAIWSILPPFSAITWQQSATELASGVAPPQNRHWFSYLLIAS